MPRNTEAADAVDRVARGEVTAAKPPPARTRSSGKPLPSEEVPPAPSEVLRNRLLGLEAALQVLERKHDAHAHAVVDQWAELEGRVGAVEAIHRDTPHAESILREEAMVKRMADLEGRVEQLEGGSPEEVSREEIIAVLAAQVDDLHRQVQVLEARQTVQVVTSSFWTRRLPRLRLGQ